MDSLSIKIKSILDMNVKDINTQIQQLSTKIDKLKIKVALDTTDINNINKVMQDIKNLMSVNNKKFKIFDGEQIKKDGIDVYTSIEKIEEKYKNLGKVTFPNKILDPITKELTGLTVQVEKADGIIEKFKYNLINIQNGANVDKGFILKGINQADNTASIQERALQETQKINLKIQQENQKVSKQKMDLLHAEALEMNKVYDNSVKAFAQAEQRKRNELQRTAQQQAQLSNKALQEDYNRMLNEAYSMNRAFDAERKRTFNLGTNLNTQTSGFTGTSKGSVEQYAKEIYGADAAVTKFSQTMNRNGQIISEATVRVNKNSKEYTEYKLKVDEATRSVNQFGEAVNRKTGKDMGVFEQFKVAMERFPIWIAATTIFMGGIHQLKNSVNYIVEMDTAITNLSKVTNLSVEQLEQMRIKSIELGEELGRTSVQIAKSMAEFGRVFKDTKSIEELSRVAVMTSNVTSLTADEAAKALNTTMITFKKDVSDAMGILDSFNEIQNNFRTSAEDLAASIGKVGAAARQAGISMEQLEGYTTSIVSSTGIEGNEAGTALKGFISRLFRIGVEGQEDAGKSEELLKSLGIQIRKNATEFKSFDEILKEINRNWQTWGNVTKQTVAQQIGSQYHLSKFIALMDNFNIATSATEKALNSQGSAFKENQKYINSLEGKINTLKLSFEKMYSSMMSSELLKGIVDGITKLVTTFGNLPSVVVAATAALLLFKGKAITDGIFQIYRYAASLTTLAATEGIAKVATMELSMAFNTLKIAFLSNPIGIIAVALTSIIGLFALFRNKVDESTEALNKLDEQIANIKDNISTLNDLSDTYTNLTSKTSLSTEEHEQLLDTQNKIAELAPDIVKAYDLEGNAIIKTKEELEEYIDKLKQVQSEKEGQKRSIYLDEYKKEQERINSLNKELKNWEYNRKRISEKTPDKYGYVNIFKGDYTGKITETTDQVFVNQKYALSEIDKSVSALNSKLRTSIDNTQTIKNKIKEGIPELTSLEGIFRKISDDLISDIDPWFAKLDASNIDAYVNSLKNIPKIINESNLKEQYENYENLNNQYKNGYITLNVLKTAYDKLKESLLGIGVNKNNVDKFVQFDINETSNYINLLDKLKGKLQEVNAEGQKNKDSLYSQFNGIEESVSDINNAIDKLMKGEELSSDEIANLITKHEELSGKLVEVNGVYTLRLDVLQNVRDSEIQTQFTSFEANNAIKSYEWETIKERLAQYGIFYNKISEMSSKSLTEQINKKAQEVSKTNSVSEIISLQKLKKETEALGQYADTLSDLNKLKNNLIGKTKSDYGKKKSDPSPIPFQDNSADLVKAYNLESERTERLAQSLEKQIDIAKSAEDYNKQLTLSNKLIETREKKIKDLDKANSQITTQANSVRKKTKYDTTGWFDAEGNGTLAYQNLIKSFEGKTDNKSKRQLEEINRVFQALSTLKKGYMDNSVEIKNQNDLIAKQRQIITDIADNKIKVYEDTQNKITDLIKKYYDIEKQKAEKSAKDEDKRLEDKKKSFKDYIDSNIKELDRQKEAEDYSTDVGDKLKEINEIQLKINPLKSAALSGDDKAQSELEDLNKDLVKKQDDLAKTQKDRSYELKKQTYQDEGDLFDKYIDSEKEKNDKKLQDYLTAVDKATSEAKLKLESVNAITNEQVNLFTQNISGEVITLTTSLTDLFTKTGENATTSAQLLEGEFLTSLTKVRDIYQEIATLYNIASGTNIKIPEVKSPNMSSNIGLMLKDMISLSPVSSILPSVMPPSIIPSTNSVNNKSISVSFDTMLKIEGGTITKDSMPLIDEKLKKSEDNLMTKIYNLLYGKGQR